MERIIQFKEADCRSCYKCIRHCDVKAIEFTGEQAYIIEEKCILCGRCTLVCPQKAKQTSSQLPVIRGLLKRGLSVSVSIAPSYVAAFPEASFSQISAALKKLGFSRVEETATGAALVSKEYTRLAQEKQMKNIITSCCPSIVMLIERYYPELVAYLAPVASPALIHGRMLKKAYGSQNQVVFIGPCISKKYEAERSEGVDAVLLFDELKEWMKEEEVSIGEEDTNPVEMQSNMNRLYPLAGGILQTISEDRSSHYERISIHGLERCISVLDSLQSNQLEGYFIEISACTDSCIDGPGLQRSKACFLTARSKLIENVRRQEAQSFPETADFLVDLGAAYESQWIADKIPDEDIINNILMSIGKTSQKAMLNCGTCGYSTCREKAIAVYQGKADLRMCLPYMREKAESTANIVLENTPNAILVIDKEFYILECNQAARRLFILPGKDIVGYPIEFFLDTDQFDRLRKTRGSVFDARCKNRDGSIFFEFNVIPAPQEDYIIIAKDVTKQEESEREFERIRNETVEIAQKVIDKQMRVAQEIASLLGETTGETKAALTKLKKTMIQGKK